MGYGDFGILCSMTNEDMYLCSKFKDIYVFPGKTDTYSDYCFPTKEQFETRIKQDYALTKVLQSRTIRWYDGFNYDSNFNYKELKTINYELTKLIENINKDKLDNNGEKFNFTEIIGITNIDDQITFMKQKLNDTRCLDEYARIIFIYPHIEDENFNDELKKIVKFINNEKGLFYLAENNSMYIATNMLSFSNQMNLKDYKIVTSLQHFGYTYAADILKEAKNAIGYDALLQDIIEGVYGKTEEEIIKNIEQIDITTIFKEQTQSLYNEDYSKIKKLLNKK